MNGFKLETPLFCECSCCKGNCGCEQPCANENTEKKAKWRIERARLNALDAQRRRDREYRPDVEQVRQADLNRWRKP